MSAFYLSLVSPFHFHTGGKRGRPKRFFTAHNSQFSSILPLEQLTVLMMYIGRYRGLFVTKEVSSQFKGL
nr:hypothetical protein CFP56_71491 [Quercus suber]